MRKLLSAIIVFIVCYSWKVESSVYISAGGMQTEWVAVSDSNIYPLLWKKVDKQIWPIVEKEIRTVWLGQLVTAIGVQDVTNQTREVDCGILICRSVALNEVLSDLIQVFRGFVFETTVSRYEHFSVNILYQRGKTSEIAHGEEDCDPNILLAGRSVNFLHFRKLLFEINNQPSPRQILLGGLCLPFCFDRLRVGLAGGYSRFLKTALTEDYRSDRAESSDGGQERRQPPISPFFPMVLSLFGVPTLFYALRTFKAIPMCLGWLATVLGVGGLIAYWGWFGFPPFGSSGF